MESITGNEMIGLLSYNKSPSQDLNISKDPMVALSNGLQHENV